jgi:hypothetical protein
MASTLFRGPVLIGKKDTSGYNIETKGSSYTVVISTDSGKTFISNTDGVVFTLPSIAIGNVFTFVNTAADGVNTLTVSPNSSDGILYLGALTDDSDVINTKSTSKVGDYVTIASLNSTAFWTVVDVQGVWAKS